MAFRVIVLHTCLKLSVNTPSLQAELPSTKKESLCFGDHVIVPCCFNHSNIGGMRGHQGGTSSSMSVYNSPAQPQSLAVTNVF